MLPRLFGPALNAEGFLQRFLHGGNHCSVGKCRELGVARGVIAVAVRVDHQERKVRGLGAQELGDDSDGIDRTRTSVHEQRAGRAEDQIEERLLVMGAAGLAQDVKGGIVFVNLPVGDF
jgi:hypothetical protein